MLVERWIEIGTCQAQSAYYNTERLSCFHRNVRKFFNSFFVKSFEERDYYVYKNFLYRPRYNTLRLENEGIEPPTSRMQSERSTPELIPRADN